MRSKKKETDLLKREDGIPEDSAIRLSHVFFRYDKEHPCLKDVSFEIKKGEFVSVIGHNGSGKSTLAKIIDGILAQDEGEIFLFGVRMNDDNAVLLRKDIGLVFQNPDSQFIGATVRDDIAFGLENECVPYEKMDSIILDCARKVGMEKELDSEPTNLSGGQKQRIAIAGAIARHPKILIFDEAGAMLDPKGKREIREIIRERKRSEPELTIITITHEIDEAYDADRVLVLNDGRLIMDDSPDKVFAQDELLRRIGLDVPLGHQLLRQLKERGLDLGQAKDEKELQEKIWPSH